MIVSTLIALLVLHLWAAVVATVPCNPLTIGDRGFSLQGAGDSCAAQQTNRFSCEGSGFLNVSIPYSRVGDGICDCCDGSDEIDTLFATQCGNSCQEVLAATKQALVTSYHKVKDGRLARIKMIDAFQRELLREEMTIDSLKEEMSDLSELKIKLGHWLGKEQSAEWWSRLAVLRKFENECALGTYEACTILDDGVNSELKVFRDIINGGYEDIDQDSDAAALAARKHREDDEKKKRKQQQAKSGDQKKELIGRDRIMSTECPRLSYEIIEESRVARIHDTLGEYLYFTESKSGVAARKLTVEQSRRSTTLFGAFLENRNGFQLAAQVFSELFGLVIALPVSVPIYVASSVLEGLYSFATYSFRECAIAGKPSLRNIRYIEETGLYEEFDSVSELTASDIEVEIEEEDEDRRWVETIYSVVSGEYTWKKYSIAQRTTSRIYTHILELTCSISTFSQLVVWLYEATLPGGPVGSALEALDYTRYPLIMDTLQIVWDYTESIRWATSIMYRAPFVWFKFLFTFAKNSKLPVRRDACTLREAYSVLLEELDSLKDRLESEIDLMAEKKEQRALGQFGKKKRRLDSDSKPSLSPEERYGASREWEAVTIGDCLMAPITGYKYELCLFGQFKQDRKVLGKFAQWSEKLQSSNEGSLDTSKITNLLGEGGYMNVPLRHKMVYDDGEFCHASGHNRKAIVSFVCDEKAAILSVAEYETCAYEVTVAHPMACVAPLEDAIMDSLDRANVFGFSSVKSKGAQKTQEEVKNNKLTKNSNKQVKPSETSFDGVNDGVENLRDEIINIDGAL